MAKFFDNIAPETAAPIGEMSDLLYQMRQSRLYLLHRHGGKEADGLLEAIRDKHIGAHPAYEDYLGIAILDRQIDILREEMKHLMMKTGQAVAATSLHLDLKSAIDAKYAGRLAEPVRVNQDALLIGLADGTAVELRYLNKDAYSFQWLWGEVLLRIDTAPGESPTADTAHFHDSAGNIVAAPVTTPAQAPWDNVQRLLDALLDNPGLTP